MNTTMPANASELRPGRQWVELIWVTGLVIAANLWSAHVQHYQVFRFWSNVGSRPFHLLLFTLYVAFFAAVMVWMRFRSTRHPASVTERFSCFHAPSEAPIRSPGAGRSC
jgi:hypothetical protein